MSKPESIAAPLKRRPTSIAQGKAVPMVVVTTLGYGVSNGPAGHVWPLWRQNLTTFAQKVFQPKGSPR